MSTAFWTDVLINFCPPNQKIVPAPLVMRHRQFLLFPSTGSRPW